MTERRFTLWEITIAFHCLSLLLIEVDVNAVSPCINRIELLEGLLIPSGFRIPSGLDRYINATSFIPPYLPSEARTSGIGWCSDDLTCDSAERQFIEVDFGAEVIIEAVAILRVGGGFVTHYSVEYAGSDRDYHCISEQTTNESVFNRSRLCDLNMEPSNFTNPVVARYLRIIPIQWVGASICLKMELFGCTIKECRNANTLLSDTITISVSSSMSTADQVLDLSNYWCGASDPVLQTAAVRLRFVQSVYLTQLQVRSNSVTFNIFPHANLTLYQNIMGFDSFRLPFNTRVVLPLWLPINTTHLEFSLSPNTLSQVCFAVKLTGCLSSNVDDHTEGATMSSDNIGTCNRPNPTPASSESLTMSTSSESLTMSTSSERAITDTNTASVYQSTSVIIVQSTSFVTVTSTVEVTASAMVQQRGVSSDSDDDCNIIAIVVPTVLVIIGLVVIVCINIIVVIKMMKRRKDVTIPKIKQATYVVENDLYQSQDSAKQTTNTGIVSQYSVVDAPDRDSLTASGGDNVPVYSKVAENREYDYLTHPPLDGNNHIPEYEVVPDTNSAEKSSAYYSVPKMPALVVNPSYTTGNPVVHNIDEQ